MAENAMDKFRPRAAVPQLPWEVGVAAEVFGRGVSSATPLFPSTHHLLPSNPFEAKGIEATAGAQRMHEALATAAWRRPGPQTDDGVREFRLNQWRLLAATFEHKCVLGRQLAAADSKADQATLVANCFAEKSTNTLARRASSITLFLKWMEVNGIDIADAMTEAGVYNYVEYLRAAGAPATRGRSFIEALFFCQGVLGLSMPEGLAASARVRGAVARSWERKRLTKKAPPIKVVHVIMLEELTCTADEHTRVVAGYLCYLIHARGRCGDVARITREPVLDSVVEEASGFLEVVADAVKTTRGKRKRRLGFPVVALEWGVGRAPWARPWLQARAAAGLNAGGDGLLMPAVGIGASYSKSIAMTTNQTTDIMRQLLVKGGAAASEVGAYTSHSCKATVLSWMAKAGAKITDRRLLGGHAKPGEFTALEYSRDALAGPLAAVADVYRHIREGRFAPDLTRSGRWERVAAPSSGQEIEGGIPFEEDAAPVTFSLASKSASEAKAPNAEELSDQEDSSSSEQGDDSSGDAQAEDVEGLQALGCLAATIEDDDDAPAGFAVRYHGTTLIRHLENDMVAGTFICGRVISNAFVSGGGRAQPLCKQCLARA
jgi:hypothetical protein